MLIGIYLFITIIIIAIIMGIFLGLSNSSAKEYHKAWEPIYKNRREHFDAYLKEALENSKSTEPVYRVAKLAARLRLEEEQKELKGYELEEFELHYESKLENYTYEYEHELRSANIE